ncbi:hypothetical protein ACFFRR_007806 [Megaselia abdita]
MKSVRVLLAITLLTTFALAVKQEVPETFYIDESAAVEELYFKINAHEEVSQTFQTNLFEFLNLVQTKNHELNEIYIKNKNNLENLAKESSKANDCVAQFGSLPEPTTYSKSNLETYRQVQQNQQFLIQYNTTAYLNYARVQVFDMVSVIENCYSQFVIDQEETVLNECISVAVENTSEAVQSTLGYLKRPFDQMHDELYNGKNNVLSISMEYFNESVKVLNEVDECIDS